MKKNSLKVFIGICVAILIISVAEGVSSLVEVKPPRLEPELVLSGHNANLEQQKIKKLSTPYSEQDYIDAVNREVENNTLYDSVAKSSRNGRKQVGELSVQEMLLRLKKQDGA
jgi:hypothetical protein